MYITYLALIIFLLDCAALDLFPPDTLVPSSLLVFTVLPLLTGPLHMLFLSLSILHPVNHYSSFSSLFKPLFLKENISGLRILVQFSSYLL